ncbi:LOW QUALITY PROTEIN: hypothetical protein KUTeg_007564 [Tegillarca granosa]|uniref:Uncharacterized protein n=1 Tax=Tegillarca granosa TaxID=220873 RepID=A0ABQ9FDL6_TEGGR|nr:LOW QUALITY PROTEIN: hypothetical protein KUTeg_007564 [Tegillarca granosa]
MKDVFKQFGCIYKLSKKIIDPKDLFLKHCKVAMDNSFVVFGLKMAKNHFECTFKWSLFYVCLWENGKNLVSEHFRFLFKSSQLLKTFFI